MKRWFAPTLLAAAAALAAQTAGAAAPRAALSVPPLIPAVTLSVGAVSGGPFLQNLGAPAPLHPPPDISANGRNPLGPAAGLPSCRLVPDHVGAPGRFAAAAEPAPAAASFAHGVLHRAVVDGAAALRGDVSAAGARSLAGRVFDGAASRKSGTGSAGAPSGADAAAPMPLLPPYLDVPEPDQAAWIARIWAEASRSRTGRSVLARVQRLAERRGRPVIVVVAPIGNAGEYAFDHEIVTIDAGFKTHPESEAAAIFMHELAHVLQLAQGLPADAFEMELEAYLVQFRVSEELGFKAKRGTFHWSAFTRFKNDVDRFMAWLLKEYDGNLAIVGEGSLDDYEAALEQRHFESQQKLERLKKRAASKRRVLERMVQTGQPARLIEQYRLDELAPLEEKIRVQSREQGWLERDLLLLRTPESRERYRRYAQRVLRKARAYHARLSAGR